MDSQTTTKLVNMERTDQWNLCECGLPFPRGLPIVARLLVCPNLNDWFPEQKFVRHAVSAESEEVHI